MQKPLISTMAHYFFPCLRSTACSWRCVCCGGARQRLMTGNDWQLRFSLLELALRGLMASSYLSATRTLSRRWQVTLIYHKKLDGDWNAAAEKLRTSSPRRPAAASQQFRSSAAATSRCTDSGLRAGGGSEKGSNVGRDDSRLPLRSSAGSNILRLGVCYLCLTSGSATCGCALSSAASTSKGGGAGLCWGDDWAALCCRNWSWTATTSSKSLRSPAGRTPRSRCDGGACMLPRCVRLHSDKTIRIAATSLPSLSQ